jgi:hypothetical protein
VSQPLSARGPWLLAALWWGGLTALALVAVPLAFVHFDNPALAGPYAARLFQVVAWSSLVISLGLLIWGRLQSLREGSGVSLRWPLLPWLLGAALAALLQEQAVAERILTARSSGGNLRLWHGLGSGLVLLQWMCALRVLWWLGRNAPAAPR